MSEQESSLKEMFLSAKVLREKMDALDSRSEDFKDTQGAAIKALDNCRDAISQMALFSTNEGIDDVSTQNLQYLAVDYLLAELVLRSYGDDDRIEQLRRGLDLLESYLVKIDHYDLLSTKDRRLLERYQADRQHFSLISTTNPEDRRNQKISRFQDEKALKSKLKMLQDKSIAINVDEDVVRSLNLAELALYVHETFQSLDMTWQELNMLSQMRLHELPQQHKGADQDGRQNQTATQAYSERLDGPLTMGGLGRKGGPLLSPTGKPLQPFTLTDKRTQIRNGVFKSGHNLPTMSIDEYLEEERRRGGIIDGGGNANASQVEPDEDNMEQVDAATMKAREWDEFVEANPKGAGNTLNRG